MTGSDPFVSIDPHAHVLLLSTTTPQLTDTGLSTAYYDLRLFVFTKHLVFQALSSITLYRFFMRRKLGGQAGVYSTSAQSRSKMTPRPKFKETNKKASVHSNYSDKGDPGAPRLLWPLSPLLFEHSSKKAR